MVEIDRKIKTLRENKGWSQEHLADVSGLATKTIQRIESGKSNASLDSRRALADAFGINVSELRESPESPGVTPPPREYILEIYYEGECIEQQIYASPIIAPLPGEQIYIIFKNKNYSNEYGNWWLVKKRRHIKLGESANVESLMLTCVPDLLGGHEDELY